MGRKSGITAEKLKEVKLGAGVLYKNFDFTSMTGTPIGITRDGATFTIEREIKDFGMDGAMGHVEGARWPITENVSISANILSWSDTLILDALPGATGANFPTVNPTHKKITCVADLTSANYITNVVMEVLTSAGGFNYYVITKGLCDGGLEVATVDKDESANGLTFTGHYSAADLNVRPWEIYHYIPGGPATFTLTYLAGPNGSITSGNDLQVVASGGDGTAVVAEADTGYIFEKWSDDSVQNPRTDTNVTSNKILTAMFVVDPS